MAVNFAEEISLSYSHVFLTCHKILRHGQTVLLPLQRKACYGFFIAIKIPSSSAGFKPANLGVQWQDYNHYITENDKVEIDKIPCRWWYLDITEFQINIFQGRYFLTSVVKGWRSWKISLEKLIKPMSLQLCTNYESWYSCLWRLL
jgi:hypothetical protein